MPLATAGGEDAVFKLNEPAAGEADRDCPRANDPGSSLISSLANSVRGAHAKGRLKDEANVRHHFRDSLYLSAAHR